MDLMVAQIYDTTQMYGADQSVMGYMAGVGLVALQSSSSTFSMEDFGDDLTFKESLKDKVVGIFKKLTGKTDDAAQSIDTLSASIDEEANKSDVSAKVEMGVLASVLALGTSITIELNHMADIKPNELYDNNLISLKDKYQGRKDAIAHQIKQLENDMRTDIDRKAAMEAGRSKLTPAVKSKLRNLTENTRFLGTKMKTAAKTLFRPGIQTKMSAPRVAIMSVLLWGAFYVVMRVLRWVKQQLVG